MIVPKTPDLQGKRVVRPLRASFADLACYKVGARMPVNGMVKPNSAVTSSDKLARGRV
jgi:hypothetical protein